MKLHDLRPADGSRQPRKRVGRGIAAGQGKTAGRGTKGQKARAGGSIPPWFEGGQTPLHQRIPKLRGFKNRFRIEYEVVNVGRIAELAQVGAFEAGELSGGKASGKAAKTAPITINQEILRAVGLVRTLDKPMKVLGHGDVEVPLFVVADAFSKSARTKIEGAGGHRPGPRDPDRAAGRARAGAHRHRHDRPPSRPRPPPRPRPPRQGQGGRRRACRRRAEPSVAEAEPSRRRRAAPTDEPAVEPVETATEVEPAAGEDA